MDPIGRRLVLTAKTVRAHFEARLAEAGSSLPFWIVLQVAREEGDVSQRALAERVGVEAPTLTRHLDRMEAEGLIERRGDPADRRVTRIHLTAAGRRLHTRLARVAHAFECEVRTPLTAAELRTLERALRRIDEHLEGAGARRAG